MTDFVFKTYRCEWQVVITPVDQYNQIDGPRKVLSAWPTREEAYADLPNHGYEHKYIPGRWLPHDSFSEYRLLEVYYKEVLQ
jgi:hypothetical protein